MKPSQHYQNDTILTNRKGKTKQNPNTSIPWDEEEDSNTNISYRCKLFVRDPTRLVAIGSVWYMFDDPQSATWRWFC